MHNLEENEYSEILWPICKVLGNESKQNATQNSISGFNSKWQERLIFCKYVSLNRNQFLAGGIFWSQVGKTLINHKKVNCIGQTTNSWSLEGENGTSNWESEIWTVCPCFLKILVNVIDFQNVGFELIITL